MDGSGQFRDRDRPRAPANYPRAPSRSSTSTTSTKVAPQSISGSSTRLVSSPPPRPSTVVHPSHRRNHSRCKTPTTPRPQSTTPARTSDDPVSQSAASSFLQERLQRRREEAEKNAAARLAHEVNSTMEQQSNTAQSSPAKGSSVDGRRPQSSGGSERNEPAKKKGMGVKEMEATVSTLHKQNFDLKLELYHRRERQNSLEDRVDALEASNKQTEEVNDQLIEELEKRDKAVQEAVQMIVLLEAQVEQLVKEREMVRQVEASGYSRFGTGDGGNGEASAPPPLDAPAPKVKMADLAKLEEDVKTLNRMPSFLSEKTESTANLRKVYLGTQGSLLSLPRLAEGPVNPDQGHGRTTSMAMRSPSLSELSESSFTSVYGEKQTGHETGENEQWSNGPATAPVDGHFPSPNGGEYGKRQRSASGTPSRAQRPGEANFRSIGSVVEQNSPLQRTESSYPPHNEASGNISSSRGNRNPAQPQPQPQLKKTRDEKRDALRRVTTDGNGRPHFDQALPPTPDTISTSTLRRFKNSNDTLVQQPGVGTTMYADDKGKPEPVAEHTGGVPVSQLPQMAPAPATSHKQDFAGQSYWDNRVPLAPRPRSADETTVSHKKGNAGATGGWGDESDDDVNDNASVHSLESSLDIWLQQGKEPKRRSTTGEGRASPDLFGFPSKGGSGAWEPGAMYGQRRRAGGPRASEGAPLHWPDPLQDLLPIQRELFGEAAGGGPGAPPPPNRRSSLHARIVSSAGGGPGSMTGAPTAAQSPRHTQSQSGNTGSAATTPQRQAPEPSGGRFRKAFSRAARRNSEGGSSRRLSLTGTPNNQQQQQQQQQQQHQGQGQQPSHHGDGTKQTQSNRSQYPPLSRPETATPRNHRRINSLWRRSLGGGSGTGSVPSSPAAPKDKESAAPAGANAAEQHATDQTDGATTTNGAPLKSSAGAGGSLVGTPYWVHRAREAEADEENRGHGATPPPIMRQPQLRQKTSGGGASGGSGGAGGGAFLDSEGAPVGDGYDYVDDFGQGYERGHEYASGKEPVTPITPVTPAMAVDGEAAANGGGASLGGGGNAAHSAAAGGRRKWLPGFGKNSSLRNRAG